MNFVIIKQMAFYLLSPAELTLKGHNRGFFERRLDYNLRLFFGKNLKKLTRYQGRRLLQVNSPIPPERLRHFFGLSRWARVYPLANLTAVKRKLKNLLPMRQYQTFAVRATSKGNPKYRGRELNITLGNFIRQNFRKNVNLEKPDLTVYLEAYPDVYFLHFGWHPAAGGLPVGVSGRVLLLFSGGIDSPLAAYLLARRGCRVDLFHFYAFDNYQNVIKSKIVQLSQLLSRYTLSLRLVLVPYRPFYRALQKQSQPGLATTLFRRFILRSATYFARQNGYQAVASGDNLAQVASQTMANLQTISQASRFLFLRPLLTFNKEEIINWSRQIGTYKLSLRPYQDCCALLAKKPKTKTNLDEILAWEKKLNLGLNLVRATLKQKKILNFKYQPD